jgi:hypothetical protein
MALCLQRAPSAAAATSMHNTQPSVASSDGVLTTCASAGTSTHAVSQMHLLQTLGLTRHQSAVQLDDYVTMSAAQAWVRVQARQMHCELRHGPKLHQNDGGTEAAPHARQLAQSKDTVRLGSPHIASHVSASRARFNVLHRLGDALICKRLAGRVHRMHDMPQTQSGMLSTCAASPFGAAGPAAARMAAAVRAYSAAPA